MRVFIFSFFLFSICQAQPINWSELDQVVFEKYILLQVNQLRDSLGLQPLTTDAILGDAAQDQSHYQLITKKVTHDQVTLHKESPSRRVAYYGGTHSLVGENCAQLDARRHGKSYKRLARNFFLSWYHSPGHYANMVEPKYRTIGIRLAVNRKNARVYATQVFGGKPYVPPTGVRSPRDAYGILDPDDRVCKRLSPFRRTAEELGSYLKVQNDSVFIYFHDKAYLNRMLKHPNDGLALDFIEPQQLPCDEPNLFHGSIVYDGVLRPPVFRYELFQNNLAHQKNRLLSFLGTVPPNLQPGSQLNLITIQNNHRCRYSSSISIPYLDIDAFALDPIFMLTEGEIIADSIRAQASHVVRFEKNVSTYEQDEFQDLLKEMGNLLPFIQHVNIEAFSSVEGDSAINQRLQQDRAEQVKAYFVELGIPDSVISYETAESWALFEEQIDSTEYEYLSDLGQNEVKTLLRNPRLEEELDYYLSLQRRAIVSITIEGIYDNKTAARYLGPALLQLSEHKDAEQAWIVQSKIIRAMRSGTDISPLSLLGKNVPDSLPFLPMINNQMAVMLYQYGDIITWTLGKSRMNWDTTVAHWLHDTLTPLPMRYHLLQQQVKKLSDFANTRGFEAHRPNLTAKEIETEIESLYDSVRWNALGIADYENFLNRLMLNYHLAAVNYHYFQNNYPEKKRSLQAVRDFFLQSKVTEAEAHRLALYFNQHQYYEWAIEVLEPWAKLESVQTKVLFDFIQTLMLIIGDVDSDHDLTLHLQRLIQRDKSLFCNWVEKYYQLKREDSLKQVYCETCN